MGELYPCIVVAVSEAKAKNIPKISREISPIKSKKEVCGEKMAVSEGPTTDEVPKMDLYER